MPTNLPPEYFEAEKRYKEATDPKEKAEALEELISKIPKHKGTDKLRAEYRKKLSKLKSAAQSKKKTGRHESQFHIDKEGDGRVVILGCANTGKSSLVNELTNAEPEISENPFTTWAPQPGMMEFENIHIQLIDTPPLERDYMEPELVDLIKNSDLVLLMLDLNSYPLQQYERSIAVLKQNRILPLHKEGDADVHYFKVKILIVVNKNDDESKDEDFAVLKELLEDEWNLIPLSLKTKRNLIGFEREIIKAMDIIRVYSKAPGKNAQLDSPFVLNAGSTVEDFAEKVHKDFLVNLKTAKIWGADVYDGQQVGRDHLLNDGDIVELHI